MWKIWQRFNQNVTVLSGVTVDCVILEGAFSNIRQGAANHPFARVGTCGYIYMTYFIHRSLFLKTYILSRYVLFYLSVNGVLSGEVWGKEKMLHFLCYWLGTSHSRQSSHCTVHTSTHTQLPTHTSQAGGYNNNTQLAGDIHSTSSTLFLPHLPVLFVCAWCPLLFPSRKKKLFCPCQ